ncbi:MAG: nucleotidyltransferase family protein [Chloroflexi bacterium]|nr:nucleotidyltransferase family protein [Chloroflexota bacterium]
MGTLKPLLDWFGAPLVQRQIESLKAGGADEVYVVTGNRAYEVQEAVRGDGVQSVINPHYKEGKSTSIKAGLAALPKPATTIMLLAVDQPRPAWLIAKVLAAHLESGALISCPRYDGHGGHPLIFAGSLRQELDRISEASHGVRKVMKAHADEINWVPVDSPIARMDMNTPEAYDLAKAEYGDLEGLA